MRIAFFGLREFFDYRHISGFQSYFRRITDEMLKVGVSVDYVMYDSGKSSELEPAPGLRLRYFKSCKEALKAMSAASYEHIVNVRLARRDRMRLPWYYNRYLKPAKYHYMSMVWPDSAFKRAMNFLEAKTVSRRGRIICASKRLYNALSTIASNTDYLLPPVPERYFLTPDEKPQNDRITITFLGVLYHNKGIERVIEVFNALKDDTLFDCRINAIYEPRDTLSVKLREWLREQRSIKYTEVDRHDYSPVIEDMVRDVLKETDVFIQPYTTLGSTVDTPLLLLEAMASLCAVITTPLGDISDIYGEGRFLIGIDEGVTGILKLLKGLAYEDIKLERQRLYKQNIKLGFESSKTARKFIKILQS